MLTKTDYLDFLECPNEFWLKQNIERPKTELSLGDRHRREQGYDVEALARQLTIFVAPEEGVVEFGKVFETEDLFAKADAVITLPNGAIEIYEVKQNASIKRPKHIEDVSFQKHVAEALKFIVARVYLITVNTDYKLDGRLSPEECLTITDVTDEVLTCQANIAERIQNAVSRRKAQPAIDTTSYCKEKKLDCEFIRHYFTEIPEYNVSMISRLNDDKLKELLKRNILDIRNVPADFKLSDLQREQVTVACSSEPSIKTAEIKDVLDGLKYPLHFLDYETFAYPLPQFQGIRAYQPLVFQYSMHTLKDRESEPDHAFCLARNDGKFPSLEVAESLREALADGVGTFIAWHASFEKQRNTALGEMHGEFADFFTEVNEKMFDLETIFTKKLYIDGRFLGKTSIKNVLPILCPQHSYKDLTIGDGDTASIRWYHMATGRGDANNRNQIYEDLCNYCHLDTLAMVDIYRLLASL